MNTKLQFQSWVFLMLACCVSQVAWAQCLAKKDSITSGDRATSISAYYYDGQNRVIKVAYTDSGNTSVGAWDSIIYNGSGQFIKVERHEAFNPDTPSRTVQFFYTANKISSIIESGVNGNGPWSKTTNITYNGSGEMFSVFIDTVSITGQPDGFPGNFDSMVWVNGNCTRLNLLVDFGLGMETFELSVTYDNKNNRRRLEYINEASALLEYYCANNIMDVVFLNNESMGPAGSKGIYNTYTYNSHNEVETRIQHPALFDTDSSITLYTYDCSLGIDEQFAVQDIDIYPNPASSKIYLPSGLNAREISLVNSLGQTVFVARSNVHEIDMSVLADGLYILKIYEKEGKAVYIKKILLNKAR